MADRFEDFAGITGAWKAHSYRLIDAAEVASNLLDVSHGDKLMSRYVR